jgi:hypothetical protein
MHIFFVKRNQLKQMTFGLFVKSAKTRTLLVACCSLLVRVVDGATQAHLTRRYHVFNGDDMGLLAPVYFLFCFGQRATRSEYVYDILTGNIHPPLVRLHPAPPGGVAYRRSSRRLQIAERALNNQFSLSSHTSARASVGWTQCSAICKPITENCCRTIV